MNIILVIGDKNIWGIWPARQEGVSGSKPVEAGVSRRLLYCTWKHHQHETSHGWQAQTTWRATPQRNRPDTQNGGVNLRVLIFCHVGCNENEIMCNFSLLSQTIAWFNALNVTAANTLDETFCLWYLMMWRL